MLLKKNVRFRKANRSFSDYEPPKPKRPTLTKKLSAKLPVGYVRSLVTEPTPGLTKGKTYRIVKFGFYRGGYLTIINDRKEEMSIYDYDQYLFTKGAKIKD